MTTTTAVRLYQKGDFVIVTDSYGDCFFATVISPTDPQYLWTKAEIKKDGCTSTLIPGYSPEKIRPATEQEIAASVPAKAATKSSNQPLTIVEIKRWLQKAVSRGARSIQRNDWVLLYNSGGTSRKPPSKGSCGWLTISTDAKRHVMIWTVAFDASEYMQKEAEKMARDFEEIIKKELGQTVPIEIKTAPPRREWISTTSGKSVHICRGESVVPATDDDDWF